MSKVSGRLNAPSVDEEESTAPAQRAPGYALKRSTLLARRDQTEVLDIATDVDVPRARDVVIANAVRGFKSEQHVVVVISDLWREAQAKFLAIGRNLREAKRAYPKAFERTILPQLPFGRQVAYQLRTIADAVDGRRFSEDEMPLGYGAAFQLAILDDGDLIAARNQGLVSPNTQRRTIEVWKRDRETARRAQQEGRAVLLREEHKHLAAESARLRARIEEIVQRMAVVEAELLSVGGESGVE